MVTFITGNKMKIAEARNIIPDLQHQALDLPELQEIDPYAIIAAKVAEAQKICKPPFFVEDTSLYMHCFSENNGQIRMPGPLVKWFLATVKNTGLADLAEKYQEQRAFAQTIIGFVDEQNKIHFFDEKAEGTIVHPQGTQGFGWDHIFVPEGYAKTYACMSKELKLSLSARGAALRKLRNYLCKK